MHLLARLKAVAVPDTPPPLSGYDWYANFCMNLNIIHGQKREKNGKKNNKAAFSPTKQWSFMQIKYFSLFKQSLAK